MALDAVAGRTSLEVSSPGVGVSEDSLGVLGWLREYGLISPVIDADILLSPQVDAGSGRFEMVRLLGVDILRDRPFRDYALIESDAPSRVTTQEFLALLPDPQAVVLTGPFTERHMLHVGDQVGLLAGDLVVPLRVAGILGSDGPAHVLDGNFALMDIAAAQLALDRFGSVDRIDIRLADNIDVAEAERAIAARLPPGLDVQRPSQRGAEVERMLRAFHFNLTALSFVALIVGLFLVYNTVSVSVVARRDEIGMLRTMGVRRRVVIGLFLGEAGLLALVGCAVGVPLGWVLAQGAVQLTSSTVSQFWVASAAEVPPLDAGMIALGFAVGVPLALVAAAVPAGEAARVAPMAAVRGDAMLETRTRLPRVYLVAPVVLFGLAVWMAQQGPVAGLPVFGLLSALAVVFGAALLMPAVLFGFCRMCGPIMGRWLRVEGFLAHANIGGAISRLAISVAALAVSLAMMVAIAVMVGSFRETVSYWIGQTLQADLFVSAARSGGGISAEAEDRIIDHPDVLAVDGFTGITVRYANSPIVVGAGRFKVLVEHGTLLFKGPMDGRAAMAAAIGDDAVVVSEAFSLKHDVQAGDTIQLPTPKGEAAFRVAGVYFDYSNDRGLVVMDVATFARHFESVRPARLAVYLRAGADANIVRDELRTALGPERRLFIRTNIALRREVLRIFDSTFAITYALEAIAIAVSMFGVAGMLLTLVLERRREIATLRLVGADRRQLRRMIVIEAGILGAVAQAVGLAVGLSLSLILIYVINVQSFGWTIQFHVPAVFLAQSSAAIFVATAVAGLYPARRAARIAVGDVTGVGE